jgi:hypothetical protein
MKIYVKGDVSICDSLKKSVSQIGLRSHRPHGTIAGLNYRLCIIQEQSFSVWQGREILF